MSDKKTQYSLIGFALTLFSQSLCAEEVEAIDVVAKKYASCAAYYLMISKADKRLSKYGSLGQVAAENANQMVSEERVLELIKDETHRLLVAMDYDWSNASLIIKENAESCKSLMTTSDS